MDIKVSRKTLILFAGIIWFLAGANIFRIGIATWLEHSNNLIKESVLSVFIFALFFYLIFKPIYKKNIERIKEKENQNHPLSFFNTKGWLTMAFMMTFGILGRQKGLFPESFILFFYTGLSSALMLTGILYLYTALKNNKGD